MKRAPLSFAEVVETSREVAALSGRVAKRERIAETLNLAGLDEAGIVVGFLIGVPRQGRFGIGWRTLSAARSVPAERSALTIGEVDGALSALAGMTGPGSSIARKGLLRDILSRCTEPEAEFLFRLIGGDLRQGASSGVVSEAIASAAGVAPGLVRQATMLGGDLIEAAEIALGQGAAGLGNVNIRLGRPIQAMLASASASVAEALEGLGDSWVDWKLDGIRIQVHRDSEAIRIWTRNLNEITERLPDVVDAVAKFACQSVILDGEVLWQDGDGRPLRFPETAGHVATHDPGPDLRDDPESGVRSRPWFFDIMYRDGESLLKETLDNRRVHLTEVCGEYAIPSALPTGATDGEAILRQALEAGHEGVVVKAAGSTYEAGRRGKAWRKVKPVHTLDLVVVAVEWGYGRRTGWLSNLHLGARDGAGGFTMVGKTFKGMTDQMLRWQTETFQRLATGAPHPDGAGVVAVRPEIVVEIAVDGVLPSTRYPGGAALRFARVIRYRDDKNADQADTIEAVRSLMV